MKALTLVLVLLLGCVSSVVTTYVLREKDPANAAQAKESVYDRVMRTGVIRCGYAVWPPMIAKDPNTGALSGIFYDYVTLLGQRMGLKIEWTTEISLATYLTDMNTGKFDLECSGGWPNATRGKIAEYTRPLFYLPLQVFVREGVTTYDNNLEALNSADVHFSVMDGEWSSFVHDAVFPKSQPVSLPGSAALGDLFEQVIAGKADAMVADALTARDFIAKRQGALRQVVSAPLTVIPNNLTVPMGEFRFLNMLNTATDTLLYDGSIERILQKYNFEPEIALRPARPYRQGPAV